MKILYDHLCFNEKYGGVSKYFIEIMKRLPQDSYELSLKYTNNSSVQENAQLFSTKTFIPHCSFRGKPRVERFVNKFHSNHIISKFDYDIYHQTHYDTYAYNIIKNKKPKITTIHDLNYIKIPQFYTNHHFVKEMESSIYKSDFIITISYNTKKDLLENYSISEKKINVIYHGIESKKANEISHIQNIPFVLYVGSRASYKNFTNVVEALSILPNKELILICTGNPLSKKEYLFLDSKNMRNRVKHIACSENELTYLYQNAVCFIYPSYYEGFGLPLLEAMINNCPIACSNTSCFPEIAGDAALFFDPSNYEEIAYSISQLYDNSLLREYLKQKGLERYHFFSWDKSAREHYDFYSSII